MAFFNGVTIMRRIIEFGSSAIASLRTPRVISIVKLIVTIVLLIFYLANGDIDGLLRSLVGSI